MFVPFHWEGRCIMFVVCTYISFHVFTSMWFVYIRSYVYTYPFQKSKVLKDIQWYHISLFSTMQKEKKNKTFSHHNCRKGAPAELLGVKYSPLSAPLENSCLAAMDEPADERRCGCLLQNVLRHGVLLSSYTFIFWGRLKPWGFWGVYLRYPQLSWTGHILD